MIERNPVLTAVCHLILVVGALLVCAPLYFAFVAGSHTGPEMQQVPQPMLPGNQFLHNLAIAWETAGFGRAFVNTVLVSCAIVVGKIALSILAGFAITYFRFPFRMTAFWLIFMSLMLPVEVRIVPTYEAVADAAGPLRWLLQATGLAALVQALAGVDVHAGLKFSLVDTYSGLTLPLIASATAVFLFRQFFLTIPDDLCEAAKLDGAGPMRFLRDVVLPLSVPNIAALAIILFIYGWNQYLWPLLFTTQKDMTTVIIALKGLLPGPMDPAEWWSYAMAASFIVMLPPAFVILALQRWFARGLVDAGK
ncbi:ABC transporter permease subunit [Nitratireductor sp. ZSWI3]|uniref:ABC transporter permease subunit n=1 Tax=Nitratireductor sp. ZSWI3 TaxID=2966359 RepID=UPI00214FE8DE|nr:ABC transporter permease subunit [Nitratireductor sp. ZSWI3]MCR4268311.1 ABC transporter permease subunit [Nitratireductor sp. ZSWI3]